MWAYRFTFYQFYSWNLRAWGRDDVPQWNACLALSFNAVANFFSVLLVVDLVAAVGRVPLSRWSAPILFCAALLAHYVYFIRGGRYLDLDLEFKGQVEAREARKVAAWCYLVGSPVVFLVLANLGAVHRAA